MLKQLKIVVGAAVTATMVACGGGGDSGGSSGGSVSVNNPLKKYEGTYFFCDGNDKSTVTFSATGADGLSVIFSSEVYSGANCSGNILGTYKLDEPALITYKDATSATLPPATVFPFSATVDRLTISIGPTTGTLKGSGVKDNCVSYSYTNNGTNTTGNRCFELVIPQQTGVSAIYLSPDNQYLVTFGLENGTLA